MGADTFPFAKPKPRIVSNTDNFRSHDYSFHIDIVDTYGYGRMTSSMVEFARCHEIPVLTYVAGGRNTGTSYKYLACLQMALALAR